MNGIIINMSKNDWLGMVCYFIVACLLGVDVAFLCLFVKENSDRIAYYGGKWNKGDLIRGGVGIGIGGILNKLVIEMFI